jgi:hypothetical protein
MGKLNRGINPRLHPAERKRCFWFRGGLLELDSENGYESRMIMLQNVAIYQASFLREFVLETNWNRTDVH